jgi:RNA polymerase-binding transcription factor DksA
MDKLDFLRDSKPLSYDSIGICEECGEDIFIKRLKARPVTTYCIACKNRMEKMEKAADV